MAERKNASDVFNSQDMEKTQLITNYDITDESAGLCEEHFASKILVCFVCGLAVLSQGRIQSKISEGVQNFQGGALFQLIK